MFPALKLNIGFFESDTAVEPDPGQVEKFAETAASRAAMILASAAPILEDEMIEQQRQVTSRPTTAKIVPMLKASGLENFDQWIRFKARVLEQDKARATGKGAADAVVREQSAMPIYKKPRANRTRVTMVTSSTEDFMLDASQNNAPSAHGMMPKSLIKLPKAESLQNTTSLQTHSNALRILAQITVFVKLFPEPLFFGNQIIENTLMTFKLVDFNALIIENTLMTGSTTIAHYPLICCGLPVRMGYCCGTGHEGILDYQSVEVDELEGHDLAHDVVRSFLPMPRATSSSKKNWGTR